MRKVDYHTHTIYSNHSDPRMTVANNVAAAARAGLNQLVILEHVPEIGPRVPTVERWKRGRNERAQLDSIAQDLAALKPETAYPGLQVIRGVEVDADPFALDGSAMLEDFSGIAVVVGSTHVFPGGGAFWFDPVSLPQQRGWKVAEEWRAWAERFVRAGRIDVLAHPGDLIFARELVPPFDLPEMQGFFDPLLAAMAEMEVAFELNELLGAKLSTPYRASYGKLVRHARSFGLQFSIASDAHSPDGVGVFRWVDHLLKEADVSKEELWSPA